MKKNILKYIVIILAIIVILLIANNIRNYMIISKMINTEMQTRKLECNNYYHQILVREHNSQKLFAVTEEFLLGDKYEKRTYFVGKLQVSQVNVTTEEVEKDGYSSISSDDAINVVKERIKEGFYLVDDKLLKEILGNYIIKPIILKNNYYVVEFKYANKTIYINKDSYLIEMVKQNDTVQTRLLNVVTENDFIEQDTSEYQFQNSN